MSDRHAFERERLISTIIEVGMMRRDVARGDALRGSATITGLISSRTMRVPEHTEAWVCYGGG